ncbi:hypothetical protein ACVIHF_002338 [Bradyrhizobium sp. USDA 4506]
MRTIFVIGFLAAGIVSAAADYHSCRYDVDKRYEACLREASQQRKPDSWCSNIKPMGYAECEKERR